MNANSKADSRPMTTRDMLQAMLDTLERLVASPSPFLDQEALSDAELSAIVVLFQSIIARRIKANMAERN